MVSRGWKRTYDDGLTHRRESGRKTLRTLRAPRHLLTLRRATRAARDGLGLGGGTLTPELFELFKRTSRSAHLLAWLKREELDGVGGEEDFRRAAETARIAQAETFGPDEPGADPFPATHSGVHDE